MSSELRIDSHHHLWRYNMQEYGWMTSGMEVLRRDYQIPELEQVLNESGIRGAVTVQARQTVEETRRLLELAGQNERIRGVVGWAPLVEPDVGRVLEKLAAHPKLKGMRHVLHDEPDDDYMLRDDFNRGVALLGEFGLAYDILIFERHLPQTLRFVDRHPNQVFIVDHIAKPRIRDHAISPWREMMKELAQRENVYCKVSGMVTEADWQNWQASELAPYFEVVLETFGARRLMFGSDWPVVILAAPYAVWVRTCEQAFGALSAPERAAIWGGTAREAYHLKQSKESDS